MAGIDKIFKKGVNVAAAVFLTAACHNTDTTVADNNDKLYLHKGDSITSLAQRILVSNVMQAIQTKGVAGAVSFCNERAMPITDSVAMAVHAGIERLSDKNRNPANAIQTPGDSLAWQKLKAIITDTLATKKHFVLQHSDGNIYYYKAITIAMPACLNCHGSKDAGIAPDALAAINQKYPADKATGYKMDELRGMWKTKMSNTNE
ncbi:MAG: DUF3365 domain-containing protein [Agriterribacter sp.]